MTHTNVLFVNTPRITGGAEVSLLTTIVNLDASRYRPSLLTPPNSMLIEQAKAIGLELHIIDFPWLSRKRPWIYLNSIHRIAKLIKKQDIGLIHTNCDFSPSYIQRACRLTQTPYISHIRDFVRGWFREPCLNALKGAERVIAVSKAMTDESVLWGTSPERVVTIYDAVDTTSFQPAGDDLRMELGIPVDALVVGIVGQIQHIKGYSEFVQAALEIAALIPNTFFLLVGRPPDDEGRELERKLRNAILESAYASAFFMVGHRDDIERTMRTIDVLAIPSWTESFGRVAVEGQAVGKVVIGTKVGGLPEIITDEENGLLISPRNPHDLSGVLQRVLRDPELRRKLGANAQISARRFSVTTHVDLIEALYDSVLHPQVYELPCSHP